jgi:hypothetical protein
MTTVLADRFYITDRTLPNPTVCDTWRPKFARATKTGTCLRPPVSVMLCTARDLTTVRQAVSLSLTRPRRHTVNLFICSLNEAFLRASSKYNRHVYSPQWQINAIEMKNEKYNTIL